MAEYYPLLVKAVGRLPNSTAESRRVVYERARKALIGQLRTHHPPVPDEDIDRESLELDRAVERLESEIANGGIPGAPAPVSPAAPDAAEPASPTSAAASAAPPRIGSGGALGPAEKRPLSPLKPRTPRSPPFAKKADAPKVPAPLIPMPSLPKSVEPDTPPPSLPTLLPVRADAPAPKEEEAPPSNTEGLALPKSRSKSSRSKGARPIAPQAPGTSEPKRRLWIIPVGIGVVVALVAVAAWKLRDRPETIARTKPAEQAQTDSGKIAERVGGPAPSEDKSAPAPATKPAAPATGQATKTQPQQAVPPAPNNPEIPVAHRAALLVEAPGEPNKVKTFLGTVIWKLNNVPQGPNDAVGLAVQADIDLPDDKMKAVVTFEKNADTSLAASHTIKVRFSPEAGSFSGDVKQISTPQMRPEASPSGEALAGVTVPIVPNSFLVGLSPGNAESANIDLIRRLQWIDIPMLLDNGKIAKLTFEKSDSGQRDLNEAFANWQK